MSSTPLAAAPLADGFSLARQKIGAVACLVVAALIPAFTDGFVLFQATMAMSFAIAVLGLNMLVGYSGQISLGHGAFFAIGAYSAAILMDRYETPYWLALVAAAAVCFVVGVLFGLPALRLEGHYLALATFALAVSVPQLLKWKRIEEWTGGVQGISLVKPQPPAGLDVSPDQWLYWIALVATAAAFLGARNLLNGRMGRAMMAIRDQPIAAAAMGIDVARVKTMTFGLSALYTGFAGALSAIAVQFVSPDSFPVFLSITLIVGVVVGGMATISGAIYGAAFIQFVPNLVDQVSKSATWAIYGLLLLVVVFALPGGIAQGLASLAQKLRRKS
ncbi:MAG: branched-chain amino acid ABC transporter permease [Pseudomonadota bacterium]